MKATDVIARDHRAVEDLFDAYKSAVEAERRDIEKKLFKALAVHEMMEDTHFYPVLKEVASDEPAVQQILDEQTKLTVKVMEKGALEVVTGEHEDRITAMMEDVLAHAKEEEDVIFPLAEQLIGAAKLEELGEKMEPESAVAKSA